MNPQSLQGPLGWSVASIIAILAFAFYAAMTIASPIFQNGATDTTTTNTDSLVEKYNMYVAVDIARFNGRSAFFKPIRIAPPTPPQPPTPPDPIVEEEAIVEYVPPAPTAPPSYMGPPLIAIIGSEAWFRLGGTGANPVIRLLVGEEQDGLTLVSTTLPSMVTVEHRTGIYEIDLFSTEEPFFRQDPPPFASDSFLEEVEG
jgi:hypothetical protein